MSDTAPHRPDPHALGPCSEALLARTFAGVLAISAKAAAGILGCDTDTLRAMTDEGLIRAVRRGKCRSYTEADIRAYLAEGPDVPCRSTNPRPARSGSTTSNSRVVAFTALQAKRRGGPPKR